MYYFAWENKGKSHTCGILSIRFLAPSIKLVYPQLWKSGEAAWSYNVIFYTCICFCYSLCGEQQRTGYALFALPVSSAFPNMVSEAKTSSSLQPVSLSPALDKYHHTYEFNSWSSNFFAEFWSHKNYITIIEIIRKKYAYLGVGMTLQMKQNNL